MPATVERPSASRRPSSVSWIDFGWPGRLTISAPLRITDHVGADVLPVFSPDGTLLMWTASRDGERSASQLWVSRPDLDAIERDLPAVPPAGTAEGIR